MTGQTWRHAIHQYKKKIERPKGINISIQKKILVHFAVDTDEVYMTTQLKDQRILPFNLGSNRAGTRKIQDGYKHVIFRKQS